VSGRARFQSLHKVLYYRSHSLLEMFEDGTIRKLLEKWFGEVVLMPDFG